MWLFLGIGGILLAGVLTIRSLLCWVYFRASDSWQLPYQGVGLEVHEIHPGKAPREPKKA